MSDVYNGFVDILKGYSNPAIPLDAIQQQEDVVVAGGSLAEIKATDATNPSFVTDDEMAKMQAAYDAYALSIFRQRFDAVVRMNPADRIETVGGKPAPLDQLKTDAKAIEGFLSTNALQALRDGVTAVDAQQAADLDKANVILRQQSQTRWKRFREGAEGLGVREGWHQLGDSMVDSALGTDNNDATTAVTRHAIHGGVGLVADSVNWVKDKFNKASPGVKGALGMAGAALGTIFLGMPILNWMFKKMGFEKGAPGLVALPLVLVTTLFAFGFIKGGTAKADQLSTLRNAYNLNSGAAVQNLQTNPAGAGQGLSFTPDDLKPFAQSLDHVTGKRLDTVAPNTQTPFFPSLAPAH
ncbi:MAG: hypothetical protein L6Q57_07115 [Alphaproteobacteria bacterium]|nr:hypothetical protein [Alphaproteobacteria bacterium]